MKKSKQSLLSASELTSVKPYEPMFYVYATLATLVCTAIPALIHQRFYFLDDFQTQYMPAFIEIARMLKRGELPFFSPRTWGGGNLIGEFQYGVLNPLYLAVYVVLETVCSTYLQYAFALVVFFHWFNAMAIVSLGRYLGLPKRLTLFICLSVQCSAFYLQWYSTSWVPGVMSFGFLVWSVRYGLEVLETQRFNWWYAVFFYLLGNSGSPYAIYGFFLFCLFAPLIYRGQSALFFIQTVLMAGLCYPGLAPTIDLSPHGWRHGVVEVFHVWRLSLEQVFLSGTPAIGLFKNWDINDHYTRSIIYIVWVFPLFMSYLFQRSFYQKREKKEWMLMLLALACLAQVMLPFPPQLRGSMKFLPNLAVFGLFATIPFLYRNRINPFKDHFRVFFLLAITFILVLRSTPLGLKGDISYIGATGLLFYFFYKINWSTSNGQNLLLGSVVAFLVIEIALFSFDPALPDFKMDGKIPTATKEKKNFEGWNLSLYDLTKRKPKGIEKFLLGNALTYTNERWINGYSANALYYSMLTNSYISRVTAENMQNAMLEIHDGKDMLDFAAIQKIWVHEVTFKDYFPKNPGPRWSITKERDRFLLTRKTSPCLLQNQELCTTYRTSDKIALGKSEDRNWYSRIEVDNTGDNGAIVIAKPWYPGMRIMLNGTEVEYKVIGTMMPIIPIPKTFHGIVEINYLSNHFLLALRLAGFFLIGLVLTYLYQVQVNNAVRTRLGALGRSKWGRRLAFRH